MLKREEEYRLADQRRIAQLRLSKAVKKNITGYTAEVWHIHYVGLPHSITMRDNNWCLEEYIEANQP